MSENTKAKTLEVFKCSGCGAESPDGIKPCDCITAVGYRQTKSGIKHYVFKDKPMTQQAHSPLPCVKSAFERAAQICRYYFKHQNFTSDDGDYAVATEIACSNLSKKLEEEALKYNCHKFNPDDCKSELSGLRAANERLREAAKEAHEAMVELLKAYASVQEHYGLKPEQSSTYIEARNANKQLVAALQREGK